MSALPTAQLSEHTNKQTPSRDAGVTPARCADRMSAVHAAVRTAVHTAQRRSDGLTPAHRPTARSRPPPDRRRPACTCRQDVGGPCGGTPANNGKELSSATCRAPDGNPVVDPVPPTNHRVATTVLCNAMIPKRQKATPSQLRHIARTGPSRADNNCPRGCVT